MHSVDLVSDFVCPWCYIGTNTLAQALAGAAVELRWHPYYLNPGVQAGIDRDAYVIAKFGSRERARELGKGVEAAAAAAGLALDLSKVRHVPDTANSHRLMRWAQGVGMATAVARALFAAHFEHGADIADPAVLVGIAASVGMDADLVAELLSGDADRQIVDAQAERARDAGISGVPSYVLNGKLLVVGAQSADVLAQALVQSAALAAEGAQTRTPPLA